MLSRLTGQFLSLIGYLLLNKVSFAAIWSQQQLQVSLMENELALKLKQSLIDKEYSIRLNQLLNGQQKLRKDQKNVISGANQPITLLPSISNTKLALSQRHRSFSASKIAASETKLNHSKSNKRVLINDKNEQFPKQSIKKQKIDELITRKQGIQVSLNKQSIIRSKVLSFKTPYKEETPKQIVTQDASLKFNSESVKKTKQKKDELKEKEARRKQLNEKLSDLEKDLFIIFKNGKIDQQSMDNKKITTYFTKLKAASNQQYNQLQNKYNKAIAFAQRFKIKKGIIFLKKLNQLKHKKVISNAEILHCFSNFKEITQSARIPGLQFYTEPPKQGKELAANKIKSFFKMLIAKKFYKNLRGLMKKVKIIQRIWRNCLLVRNTRRRMLERANQRIKKHSQLQEKFCGNWNIIKTSQRIQVHICSYSLQQFKKLTINHLRQRQNSQITRVFRAFQTDLTVIYVTPFHLPEEIVNYYKSLFNFNNRNIGNDIFFVVPQNLPKIEKKCSLITTVSALLYSPKALKRIKQIISNNYAYIVPSFPSVEFINLSVQLSIPIFGPQQNLAKLFSTKSGSLKLLGNAAKKQKAPFCINKSVQGIHTEKQLINTLSVLIYRNKEIKVWYFKIEDEINSRGLAYLNINKIAFLREVCDGGQWDGVQQTQMIALIAQELTVKLENRLKIVNKDVYANYKQYITHFFTRGGVVEASYSFGESNNFSIGLMIEPNGDFCILGTYNKMQLGGKSINQAISFPSKQKNVDYQAIARHVYKQVWVKQKMFGFLSVDFVYRQEDESVAAIGLDFFLNQKLSSLFMVKFCCRAEYDKNLNTLVNSNNQSLNYIYCPHLTLLKLPQMITFFKNCKFQNISFDLQEQLGIIFILLDRFQNQQISFIVAEKNQENLLKGMKKLIDYFCENFRAQKQAHDELGLLRGAITTGLKKITKLKMSHNNSMLANLE